MMLSKRFSLEEMIASQTATRMQINNNPNEAVIYNLRRTCELMDHVWDVCESPIITSSGYRSSELNRFIGGARNSQHVIGCACDFTVRGMILDDVMEEIIAANLPYDQLIREFDAWLHISVPNDVNSKPRRQALIIDHEGTRAYE